MIRVIKLKNPGTSPRCYAWTGGFFPPPAVRFSCLAVYVVRYATNIHYSFQVMNIYIVILKLLQHGNLKMLLLARKDAADTDKGVKFDGSGIKHTRKSS